MKLYITLILLVVVIYSINKVLYICKPVHKTNIKSIDEKVFANTNDTYNVKNIFGGMFNDKTPWQV